MVRSLDAILKEKFDLPLGLADNAKDPVTQKPRVQILDPATGTGTFLYEVVKQIYRNLEDIGMATQWDSYVRDNLLNRLFGFELLMAPYAIAHLKLGLQLQELGYKFQGKQRLGVYLTNTLDQAIKQAEVLFGSIIAKEANDAAEIKKNTPIMIILGNPPYAVKSKNPSKRKRVVKTVDKFEIYLADIQYTGEQWNRIFKKGKRGSMITELTYIGELMERYKGRVRLEREKNISPLDNDYIKFIRFSHHRIEQTGYGITGFITANSYLNGLIHRGMREELLKTFDLIYIIDLHGIAGQTCPDGSPDKNVFDISEGVSILIAVKDQVCGDKAADKLAHLLYYDLWGQRQFKYNFLSESSVDSIGEDWIELEPTHPNFFFSPKDFDLNDEYKKLVSIEEILMLNSSGIKTHHDHFVIDFEVQTLERRMSNFISLDISDQEIKDLYKLEGIALSDVASMRKAVSRLNIGTTIKPILYRPFDVRHLFYDESCCERLRTEVMDHLLKENLCSIVCRQQKDLGFYHSFVTEYVGDGNTISIKSREYNYYFPLYRYPETENDQGSLFVERSSNISSNFLSVVREKLGYVPTPEAIFYYIYAIFHSPTYRQRYAEFLKIDFPRVPLTSNDQL